MLSDVPRDQAGIRVKASARREADNKGDSLTLVEFLRWRLRYADEKERSDSCWK
jgi:hypothetical protein